MPCPFARFHPAAKKLQPDLSAPAAYNLGSNDDGIIAQYHAYLSDAAFPCVAAKSALQRDQVACGVFEDMAKDADDQAILDFLYGFVDRYRASKEFFHSAAIIFKTPARMDELQFENLLWQRLQGLADLDARHHAYDPRVDSDPESPNFSFSVKGEAFFVIGIHPGSSRVARQFAYPALVFNPHQQFETLREKNRFDAVKNVVRKRDIALEGSFNPMLDDFGVASEVHQYSGRQHDHAWKCPLIIPHGRTADYTAA